MSSFTVDCEGFRCSLLGISCHWVGRIPPSQHVSGGSPSTFAYVRKLIEMTIPQIFQTHLVSMKPPSASLTGKYQDFFKDSLLTLKSWWIGIMVCSIPSMKLCEKSIFHKDCGRLSAKFSKLTVQETERTDRNLTSNFVGALFNNVPLNNLPHHETWHLPHRDCTFIYMTFCLKPIPKSMSVCQDFHVWVGWHGTRIYLAKKQHLQFQTGEWWYLSAATKLGGDSIWEIISHHPHSILRLLAKPIPVIRLVPTQLFISAVECLHTI